MNTRSSAYAQVWHGLTAVVVIAALVIQFVLVVEGASVLVADDPPGLGTRIVRYFCYFTIQSNILIAVVVVWLACAADADGWWFRTIRVAGLVGITVTAVVHFFLLRPLLDLTGWSRVVDVGLHQVVPVLAIVGWLLFGPRPRIDWSAIKAALVWPIAWLAVTLVAGVITGWVPYPFLNYRKEGWASVIVVCLGVLVFALALFGGFHWLDRRLAPTQAVRNASSASRTTSDSRTPS